MSRPKKKGKKLSSFEFTAPTTGYFYVREEYFFIEKGQRITVEYFKFDTIPMKEEKE